MAPPGHIVMCGFLNDGGERHYINRKTDAYYTVSEYEEVASTPFCCVDCINFGLGVYAEVYEDNISITWHPNNTEQDTDSKLSEEENATTTRIENYPAAAKEQKRIILQSKYPSEEDCSVCLGEMKNRVVAHTPCGHKFHSKCLTMWRETSGNAHCPLCRGALTKEQLISNEIEESGEILLVNQLPANIPVPMNSVLEFREAAHALSVYYNSASQRQNEEDEEDEWTDDEDMSALEDAPEAAPEPEVNLEDSILAGDLELFDRAMELLEEVHERAAQERSQNIQAPPAPRRPSQPRPPRRMNADDEEQNNESRSIMIARHVPDDPTGFEVVDIFY